MSSTADTHDLLDELLRVRSAYAPVNTSSAITTIDSIPELVTGSLSPDIQTISPAHAQSNEIEELRTLLLTPERQRIALLEAHVTELKAQLQQRERFVAMLTPLVAEAIAQKVRDSREEMAEALYPVIGKSITRAVQEAIRDLAREIDATMRRSLRPRFVQRWGMRLRGVDPQDAALRGVLPFQMRDLLLIHRESGLLLLHHSFTGTLPDADLISGMLTAVQSYVQDSFGAHASGSLDGISYGDLRILISEGSAVVLAVVAQGIEPAGFQEQMRQQVSELHVALGSALRAYNGTPLEERLLLRYCEPLMELSNDPAQGLPHR